MTKERISKCAHEQENYPIIYDRRRALGINQDFFAHRLKMSISNFARKIRDKDLTDKERGEVMKILDELEAVYLGEESEATPDNRVDEIKDILVSVKTLLGLSEDTKFVPSALTLIDEIIKNK